MDGGAWQAEVHGVTKSRTRLNDFTFTFHLHALEKETAGHSSVLAWRIPGTRGLVGCHLWGRTESDATEATQQQQQQSVVNIFSHLLSLPIILKTVNSMNVDFYPLYPLSKYSIYQSICLSKLNKEWLYYSKRIVQPLKNNCHLKFSKNNYFALISIHEEFNFMMYKIIMGF